MKNQIILKNIEYFKALKMFLNKYNINKKDCIIVGSSVLSAHGLRLNNDIDFALSPKAYNHFLETNSNSFEIVKTGRVIISDNLEIIKNKYEIISISDDDLFNNSDYYYELDGFKLIKLEIEFYYKNRRRLSKDFNDINLIERKVIEDNYNYFSWEILLRIIDNDSKNNPLHNYNHYAKFRNKIRKAIVFYKNNRKSKIELIKYYIVKIIKYIKKHIFGLLSKQKMKNYPSGNARHTEPIDIILFNRSNIMRFLNQLNYIDFQKGNSETNVYNIDLKGLVKKRQSVNLIYDIHNNKQIKVKRRPTIGIQNLFFILTPSKNRLKNPNVLFKNKQYLINTGFFYTAIIWNPGFQVINQLKEDIAYEGVIIDFEILEIYNFENFVREMYSSEDVEKWKIETKLAALGKFDKKIGLMHIYFDNPHYIWSNGEFISKNIKDIKIQLRRKWSNKIDWYFHDIIIHIGLNSKENKSINKILKKYLN